MALNIKSEEAHRLAQELARETGESITQAVTVAIQERLASVKRRTAGRVPVREISQLQAFVASLPDRDRRSPDEILGYDELGLPR